MRKIFNRIKWVMAVALAYISLGFCFYLFLASAPLLLFAYYEEIARYEQFAIFLYFGSWLFFSGVAFYKSSPEDEE